MENNECVLVDTREDIVFNGFELNGVKGHLKEAIHFSTSWLDFIKKEKLNTFINQKGITEDKTIILYDDSYERSIILYSLLTRDLNFKKVYIFSDLTELYINHSEHFVVYPRYSDLVDCMWLNDLIHDKQPETYDNSDCKIFYCNSQTNEKTHYQKYKDYHIPGAGYINIDELEGGPLLNINDFSILKPYFSKLGITINTTIILYGETMSASARAWLILKWAGVKDVRILNGGMRSWNRYKLPLEYGDTYKNYNVEFGVNEPQNTELVIETGAEIFEKQQKDNLKLVSIRSWEEHVGDTSGYSLYPEIDQNISVVGEPKGAIYGFAGKGMKGYYNPGGTLRNPEEMAKLWSSQQVYEDDLIAFYCGTGWRASLSLFVTHMLGWEKSKLYGGSWIEWQTNSDLPLKEFDPDIKEIDLLNDFE